MSERASDPVGTVVIVGAGIAGATAALTLRTEGYDGRVVLIGDEPHQPYRRPPLSKDVLRGSMAAERTRLKSPEHWANVGIELRTATTVAALDLDAREVVLDGGERLGYDTLLLATGGRPRALPLAEGLSRTHALRSLADVAPLRAAITEAGLLVIGAGLIGAEVAASARAMGVPVTVLEAAPIPMGRLLPPELAQVYAALHRDRGVALHTGVTLTSLHEDGDAVVATDAAGRRHQAGAVVVAVGMVPNAELAAEAGLAVDPVLGGVLVDEFCRTADPRVYAAGDVANQPNLLLGGRHRVEHWQGAQEHGAAAARSILGAGVPFDAVPWLWSEQYGVNLQVCGWPSATDEVTVRGELAGLDFVAEFRRAGRLVGAVGVNRAADIRALRKQIAEPTQAVA